MVDNDNEAQHTLKHTATLFHLVMYWSLECKKTQKRT
ncbi:MAG: hypothetical protein ACJAW1_002397 [Glaciecola sp.]|jgi:hypothetical protein